MLNQKLLAAIEHTIATHACRSGRRWRISKTTMIWTPASGRPLRRRRRRGGRRTPRRARWIRGRRGSGRYLVILQLPAAAPLPSWVAQLQRELSAAVAAQVPLESRATIVLLTEHLLYIVETPSSVPRHACDDQL